MTQGRQVERIGPVVIILISTMILVFAYILTWADTNPKLAQASMSLLVMAMIGIMGRFAWAFIGGQQIRPTLDFSVSRLGLTALSATFLVIAAAGMWKAIQAEMISKGSVAFLAGTTITIQRAFYVLAAISEECFFTWGIMLGGIVLLSNRKILFLEKVPFPGTAMALLGSCVLFAIWHTAVYGTGEILQLMFIYRLLFGMSYIISGMLWGEKSIGIAMLAHATINFVAV